jgi:hypothetical protein
MWQGGAGQGQRFEPTATLRVAGENTGFGAVFDMTGDGVADVISGGEDGFALRVWPGGPTLAGEPSPAAKLATDGLRIEDVRGADLTGDGVFDVFSNLRDESGPFTFIVSGHVWQGSATLAGDVRPRATLTRNSRVRRFVDLTGDGIDDVLTGFATSLSSPAFQGECLFAGGGALAGEVEARATLETLPRGRLDVRAHPQSYWIADVDENGILDIITYSFHVRSMASFFRHDIAVFAGGAELQGAPPLPVATARLEGTGSSVNGLADVTGDGRLDLLCIQSHDFVRVWAELHTGSRPFLLGPD